MSILNFLPGLSNRKERDIFVSNFLSQIPVGFKLLDAGAGECRYKKYCTHLDYLSQDFCAYVGKDQFGSYANPAWDTSLIDIACDITDIPLPNCSFDIIICCEVFEHLPNPDLAFQELVRLIKPGGKILITAPFRSLYHQTPYFFYSGFSTYFYENIAISNNMIVSSIHENGDYRNDFLQEFLRIYRSLSFLSKIVFFFPYTLSYLFFLFVLFVLRPVLPQSTHGYFIIFEKPNI